MPRPQLPLPPPHPPLPPRPPLPCPAERLPPGGPGAAGGSRHRVAEGPGVAIEALAGSFAQVLGLTGVAHESVRAVGLDTPGPASADGVISSRGAVNFVDPAWRGFDVRSALEARLGLPVIYNNDANVASLYAHHSHFGPDAARRSSVSLIVGTGLGGGVIEGGQVVRGAAGMAGEFG